MKYIEVVAAVIISENKILCVQRNQNKYDYISFKYEFPGGKIEGEESREQALKREIMEELNMDIEISNSFLTVYHQYPDFHLTMHSYICSCKDTTLVLREHIAFKWLTFDKLQSLNWAAADLPIVEKIINNG